MSAEKRMLFAIILWVVLVMLTTIWLKPEQAKQPQVTTPTNTATNNQVQPEKETTKTPLPVITTSTFTFQTNTLKVSPNIKAVITSEGGGWILYSIRGLTAKTNEEVVLFKTNISTFTLALLSKTNQTLTPLPMKFLSKSELKGTITYGKSRFEVSKKMRYTGSNYLFVFDITVKNLSKEKAQIPPLGLFWRGAYYPLSAEPTRYDETKIIYFSEKNLSTETPPTKGGLLSKAKPFFETTDAKWVGAENNYFLSAVIPDFKASAVFIAEPMSAGFVLSGELEKRETKKFRFYVYSGPKQRETLLSAGFGLISTMKYSFLGFIMEPLEVAITKGIFFFYDLTKNYGLAIILIALLVKIVLFPLSFKASVSMKRMQLLQPKIEELKKQYSSDPRLFQQKVAELYKQEGVSPASGCLPMLLQLPVFFALYYTLTGMLVFKGAGFLWINDLSSPDTLFLIPFFKNIPLMPYHFNLLPLIMTGVSILQTYYTNPKKKMTMNTLLLPLVFLFFFWNFPSGLVLYWTSQNIFSTIEQLIVNKFLNVKV